MDYRPDAEAPIVVSRRRRSRGRGRPLTSSRLLRLTLAAVSVGAVGAADAAAQIDGCAFGNRGRNDGSRDVLPGTGGVFYVGGPHFVCDDGSQIFADSSITYEAQDMHHLIGNVRYFGDGRRLDADEVRYFSGVGRMQATGNVSLVDEEGGSTIRNGDLVLLLTTPTRDEEEMTVVIGADGVRPIAIITPPETTAEEVGPAVPEGDSLATGDSTTVGAEAPAGTEDEPEEPVDPVTADTVPPTPYTVVGDRMFLRGAGYFTATGSVEIVRDSLFAWADSAEYGREDGGLHLAGAARVESSSYELLGETITMGAPGVDVSEVRARRAARLIGDDLELTAAEIVMVLRDDALERLVAIPLSSTDGPADSIAAERPRAVVDDFVLRADSLEVNTPGEKVERVFASGRARSESTSGDSLNVEILPGVATTDWLEGDTIVVTFVPDTATVTTDGEEDEIIVDRIVARVSARSLYRLTPNDTTARAGVDPPAVHYVTGAEIRILMDAGEVSRMNVIGQTRGIHLEPLRRQAAADTTAADTTAVDTLSMADLGSSPHDEDGAPSRPNRHDPPEYAASAIAVEEAPWTSRPIP